MATGCVICHGDLHPFNLLLDGSRVTPLDWSTAVLASRSYDVACTSLALSEAAPKVPGWLRPPVRWIGRRLAGRFVRSYQRRSGVVIDQAELAYPWLASGSTFAARLTAVTGVAVSWRRTSQAAA